MTQDRQVVKDWLHSIRGQVEGHAGVKDPLAKFKAEDDHDVKACMRIFGEGTPQKSYTIVTRKRQ